VTWKSIATFIKLRYLENEASVRKIAKEDEIAKEVILK
jgi:hypothetical protein